MPDENKYWTVVLQFRTEEDDPTGIPPNFVDRVMAATQAMHVMGFGLEVVYGTAPKEIVAQVDTES
jgi:hypothetical protein